MMRQDCQRKGVDRKTNALFLLHKIAKLIIYFNHALDDASVRNYIMRRKLNLCAGLVRCSTSLLFNWWLSKILLLRTVMVPARLQPTFILLLVMICRFSMLTVSFKPSNLNITNCQETSDLLCRVSRALIQTESKEWDCISCP